MSSCSSAVRATLQPTVQVGVYVRGPNDAVKIARIGGYSDVIPQPLALTRADHYDLEIKYMANTCKASFHTCPCNKQEIHKTKDFYIPKLIPLSRSQLINEPMSIQNVVSIPAIICEHACSFSKELPHRVCLNESDFNGTERESEGTSTTCPDIFQSFVVHLINMLMRLP